MADRNHKGAATNYGAMGEQPRMRSGTAQRDGRPIMRSVGTDRRDVKATIAQRYSAGQWKERREKLRRCGGLQDGQGRQSGGIAYQMRAKRLKSIQC